MQGLFPMAADVRNTWNSEMENRREAPGVYTEGEDFIQTALSSSPFLLVVDDSPTVRKILEVCLQREGYQVRSFADGIELLSWLMNPGAHIPALVVVDVNLPKMDGYTLIRHLKAKPAFAGTVFIILSGRSGMLDRLKGRLSGAQVYLTKPFRTDEVLAAVHSCLCPSPHEQTAASFMEVASR